MGKSGNIMEDDNVRKHLMAALDKIIESEKKRLYQFYDDSGGLI